MIFFSSETVIFDRRGVYSMSFRFLQTLKNLTRKKTYSCNLFIIFFFYERVEF